MVQFSVDVNFTGLKYIETNFYIDKYFECINYMYKSP